MARSYTTQAPRSLECHIRRRRTTFDCRGSLAVAAGILVLALPYARLPRNTSTGADCIRCFAAGTGWCRRRAAAGADGCSLQRALVSVCAAGAGSVAAPPSADQLLTALGRHLWVAGDELMEASVCLMERSSDGNSDTAPGSSPMALAQGATSLRTAADLVLDGYWGDAWGELEVMSASCEQYFPLRACQGLIDLFGYEEPVPECGWPAASASLWNLGARLQSFAEKVSSKPMLNVRAGDSLAAAAEALDLAARLFVAGGFKMPSDPREVGPQWSPQEWVSTLQEQEPVLVAGSYAAALLAEVKAELQRVAADGPKARRSVLRQLVRRTHPDQNAGHETEVLPVLSYVQELRERER